MASLVHFTKVPVHFGANLDQECQEPLPQLGQSLAPWLGPKTRQKKRLDLVYAWSSMVIGRGTVQIEFIGIGEHVHPSKDASTDAVEGSKQLSSCCYELKLCRFNRPYHGGGP